MLGVSYRQGHLTRKRAFSSPAIISGEPIKFGRFAKTKCFVAEVIKPAHPPQSDLWGKPPLLANLSVGH